MWYIFTNSGAFAYKFNSFCDRATCMPNQFSLKKLFEMPLICFGLPQKTLQIFCNMVLNKKYVFTKNKIKTQYNWMYCISKLVQFSIDVYSIYLVDKMKWRCWQRWRSKSEQKINICQNKYEPNTEDTTAANTLKWHGMLGGWSL